GTEDEFAANPKRSAVSGDGDAAILVDDAVAVAVKPAAVEGDTVRSKHGGRRAQAAGRDRIAEGPVRVGAELEDAGLDRPLARELVSDADAHGSRPDLGQGAA